MINIYRVVGQWGFISLCTLLNSSVYIVFLCIYLGRSILGVPLYVATYVPTSACGHVLYMDMVALVFWLYMVKTLYLELIKMLTLSEMNQTSQNSFPPPWSVCNKIHTYKLDQFDPLTHPPTYNTHAWLSCK